MDNVRSWIMITLTLIFVLLYGAALIGWLKPLPDENILARLEPIIFIIIGYYVGRLPGQQNETNLKEEINRLVQKANAAQHAKEQAQQARDAMEEKMKNVNAALTSSTASDGPKKEAAENLYGNGSPVKEDALRHSVRAALSILNS